MLTPELLSGLINAGVRFHQLPNGDELLESQFYELNGYGGVHAHAPNTQTAKTKVASFPEFASDVGVPADVKNLVATPLGKDKHHINGWFVRPR